MQKGRKSQFKNLKEENTARDMNKVPSDMEIASNVRRCSWLMDYWENGGLPVDEKHKNPVESVKWKDAQTNSFVEVSRYGWEVKDQKIVVAREVAVQQYPSRRK
jgi:hypothetical protein